MRTHGRPRIIVVRARFGQDRACGPVPLVPLEVGMTRTVRSVALVAGAALTLSACGLLAGLIPEQEVPGGVLGLGGGVQVELEASGVGPSIDVTPTTTTWVGTLTRTFDLDALTGSIPNVVSPDAITETIELGDTIVVRNPGFATGPFTVTGLALGGTFALGGQTFGVPANLAVTGLDVLFEDPDCVDDAADLVCTYTTVASSPPSLVLAFTPQQVAAFWSLLSANGGAVSVDLTVTVTLQAPGLPTAATVTVTIDSGGATIEF
jgi:hypothetical protein